MYIYIYIQVYMGFCIKNSGTLNQNELELLMPGCYMVMAVIQASMVHNLALPVI